MFIQVRVCVYVSAQRILLTSGVIWTSYDWLNKFYSFYIAAVVDIVNGCDLSIDVRCRNQPNKSKVALYNSII